MDVVLNKPTRILSALAGIALLLLAIAPPAWGKGLQPEVPAAQAPPVATEAIPARTEPAPDAPEPTPVSSESVPVSSESVAATPATARKPSPAPSSTANEVATKVTSIGGGGNASIPAAGRDDAVTSKVDLLAAETTEKIGLPTQHEKAGGALVEGATSRVSELAGKVAGDPASLVTGTVGPLIPSLGLTTSLGSITLDQAPGGELPSGAKLVERGASVGGSAPSWRLNFAVPVSVSSFDFGDASWLARQALPDERANHVKAQLLSVPPASGSQTQHSGSHTPLPPPMPMPGSSTSATASPNSFIPLVALLALLALVAPTMLRRLGGSAAWRPPTPFVCGLERPG